jgi:hypothetical protein
MPLQRALHFIAIAIVRSEEIATDQEQDERCCIQMAIHFLLPDTARYDLAAVPGGNQAITLQYTQMALQLFPQGSVSRRIRTGIEDFNGGRLLLHTAAMLLSLLKLK